MNGSHLAALDPTDRPGPPAPPGPPGSPGSAGLLAADGGSARGADAAFPRAPSDVRRFELLGSPGVLSILCWGASFVATRRALDGFTPVGIVALRFLIGAAAVGVLQLARGGKLLPERVDRPRCVLLGLILGTHIGVQAFALQHTTAVHSGWIVAFNAVAIVLGSAVFLGERVSPRAMGGIVVATSGLALVVLARTPNFADAEWGDLLVLSSCIPWTAYTLLSKRPIASSGAWRVTPLVMAVAGLLALCASTRTGVVLDGPEPPNTRAWIAIAFLGLGSSALAFTAWAKTLESFGALRAGVLLYLQPFVTLGLAYFLLDEPIGWTVFLGGPLVLLGVAVASRR